METIQVFFISFIIFRCYFQLNRRISLIAFSNCLRPVALFPNRGAYNSPVSISKEMKGKNYCYCSNGVLFYGDIQTGF